jgi:hypothetical protein
MIVEPAVEQADAMEFSMDDMISSPAPEAPVVEEMATAPSTETKEIEIDEFGIEEMPTLMTTPEEKPADDAVWEFK